MKSPKDVDEYIAGFSKEVQAILEMIRGTIQKAAPEAKETIKYQIPTIVLGENLVHFAAFKHHIGFYPTPSGIQAFKHELAHYKSAKGSVRFPIDEPMPLSLIDRVVRFRVEEVKAKSSAKK